MDISKANEILKTIEKRGPFFAFDEIDQNKRAREYFFELQNVLKEANNISVAGRGVQTRPRRAPSFFLKTF